MVCRRVCQSVVFVLFVVFVSCFGRFVDSFVLDFCLLWVVSNAAGGSLVIVRVTPRSLLGMCCGNSEGLAMDRCLL